MEFRPTAIPEIIAIEPRVFGDDRGFFMETFRQTAFAESVGDYMFVQDNFSFSAKHILRGIHYQIHQPQGKLVRVVQGEVLDVAVDLRKSSPTFGQWVGERLSDENKRQLWVPPGFGHAFFVLSETAGFEYKCTDYYAPEHERSIRWDDPDIGVDWQLPDGSQPILSEKDAAAPFLRDAETYS